MVEVILNRTAKVKFIFGNSYDKMADVLASGFAQCRLLLKYVCSHEICALLLIILLSLSYQIFIITFSS